MHHFWGGRSWFYCHAILLQHYINNSIRGKSISLTLIFWKYCVLIFSNCHLLYIWIFLLQIIVHIPYEICSYFYYIAWPEYPPVPQYLMSSIILCTYLLCTTSLVCCAFVALQYCNRTVNKYIPTFAQKANNSPATVIMLRML